MAWLSGWEYRKDITLARASGLVTNYQMKLLVGESSGATGENVDCGGKCLSSFNDLRFTNSNGATLLDYWIESITGTTPNQLATVWIEFDSIGTSDTQFYMYYGNATASAVSSGANTFILFDDFNDNSLDTNKWEVIVGTWQETGGLLKGTCANNASAILLSKNQISPTDNYAVEATIAAQYGLTTINYQSGLAIHHEKALNVMKGYWLDLSGYDKWIIIDKDNGVTEGTQDTNFDARNTTLYSLRKNGTTHKLYVEGVEKVSRTYEWPTAPQYVGFYLAYQANYANYNNFKVRQYLATEPAWGTWGAEENDESFTTESAVASATMDGITPVESTTESAEATDTFDGYSLRDSFTESAEASDTFGSEKTAYGVTTESAEATDAMAYLHMVDEFTDSAVVASLMDSEEIIRKRIRFPNLQGKHLSLKFTSATDGSFAIYYLRHKMFKARELTSDQKHPNTQGSHIGIKLSNSGSDAFTLMYVSEKMQLVTT